MPYMYISESEANELKRESCPHCGSRNTEFIHIFNYICVDDSNPHTYDCQSCGKSFTVYK